MQNKLFFPKLLWKFGGSIQITAQDVEARRSALGRMGEEKMIPCPQVL